MYVHVYIIIIYCGKKEIKTNWHRSLLKPFHSDPTKPFPNFWEVVKKWTQGTIARTCYHTYRALYNYNITARLHSSLVNMHTPESMKQILL